MAIKLVSKGDGQTRLLPQKASTTVTKDTLGVFDANWYVTACASTATYADFLILQTQTADSGETPDVLVHFLTGAEFLEADCTNNTALNQLGNSHDLTSAGVVANTSSDGTYKCIKALGLVWSASDKKLFCKAVVRAA